MLLPDSAELVPGTLQSKTVRQRPVALSMTWPVEPIAGESKSCSGSCAEQSLKVSALQLPR